MAISAVEVKVVLEMPSGVTDLEVNSVPKIISVILDLEEIVVPEMPSGVTDLEENLSPSCLQG